MGLDRAYASEGPVSCGAAPAGPHLVPAGKTQEGTTSDNLAQKCGDDGAEDGGQMVLGSTEEPGTKQGLLAVLR